MHWFLESNLTHIHIFSSLVEEVALMFLYFTHKKSVSLVQHELNCCSDLKAGNKGVSVFFNSLAGHTVYF